jgi:hypothetical protein
MRALCEQVLCLVMRNVKNGSGVSGFDEVCRHGVPHIAHTYEKQSRLRQHAYSFFSQKRLAWNS